MSAPELVVRGAEHVDGLRAVGEDEGSRGDRGLLFHEIEASQALGRQDRQDFFVIGKRMDMEGAAMAAFGLHEEIVKPAEISLEVEERTDNPRFSASLML